VRIEVVQHDVDFLIRIAGHGFVDEIQELDAAPTLVVSRPDPAWLAVLSDHAIG
jgi:hypothetical protein